MTLIIGVKCKDGVVMGSDSAATFSAMGQNTIRQDTRKLDILGESVIVGISGYIGLGQRIRAQIQALWTDSNLKFEEKEPYEAMTIMRIAIWNNHIHPEVQAAQAMIPVIGQQLALQSALAQTVVCLPLSGGPCLFQFDQQGAPEEATETLPFVAIGSG